MPASTIYIRVLFESVHSVKQWQLVVLPRNKDRAIWDCLVRQRRALEDCSHDDKPSDSLLSGRGAMPLCLRKSRRYAGESPSTRSRDMY